MYLFCAFLGRRSRVSIRCGGLDNPTQCARQFDYIARGFPPVELRSHEPLGNATTQLTATGGATGAQPMSLKALAVGVLTRNQRRNSTATDAETSATWPQLRESLALDSAEPEPASAQAGPRGARGRRSDGHPGTTEFPRGAGPSSRRAAAGWSWYGGCISYTWLVCAGCHSRRVLAAGQFPPSSRTFSRFRRARSSQFLGLPPGFWVVQGGLPGFGAEPRGLGG